MAEGQGRPPIRGVTGKVVDAAKAKGSLLSEMAPEVLRDRARVAALDERLEELVSARPEAEVVRRLPGMGVLFTAEFLSEVGAVGRFSSANALAAAAGLVPATRQSANSSFQQRARRGNHTLQVSTQTHEAPVSVPTHGLDASTQRLVFQALPGNESPQEMRTVCLYGRQEP